MSAKSGRSILRSLYEPALKGTATAGKVLVCDSNTNITGLTLTNPTIIGLTLDGGTISKVYDNIFAVANSTDPTKLIEFSAVGNTLYTTWFRPLSPHVTPYSVTPWPYPELGSET
jgi:hypothetical protein